MEPLSLFKLALYCAEGTDEDSHTISRNLSLAAHLYRLVRSLPFQRPDDTYCSKVLLVTFSAMSCRPVQRV